MDLLLKGLLCSYDLAFETRTYFAAMAPQLGITSDKDLNLLLTAFEIAKIYDAKVLEGEKMFLIIKDNEWCILLAHGSQHRNEKIDKIASIMSDTFEFGILGMCYSSKYALRSNICGFSYEVTITDVIKKLQSITGEKKNLNTILSSSLKNYKLTVTPQCFSVTNVFAITGIFAYITGLKAYSKHKLIPYSNILVLTEFGAEHISGSSSNVVNSDIELILSNTDIQGVYRACILVIFDSLLHLVIARFSLMDAKSITYIIVGPERLYGNPNLVMKGLEIKNAGKMISQEELIGVVTIGLLLAKLWSYLKNHYGKRIKEERIISSPKPTSGLLQAPDLISDYIAAAPLGGYPNRFAQDLWAEITTLLVNGAEWIYGVILYIYRTVIVPRLNQVPEILLGLVVVAVITALTAFGIEELAHFDIPVAVLCFSLVGLMTKDYCTVHYPQFQNPYNNHNLPIETNNIEEDDDQDGISNSVEEYYYNLYPTISNGYTNPITWLDGSLDPDNDELSTLFEISFEDLTLDPFLSDTDRDGVNDLEEVRNLYPENTDTDSDNIPDMIEMAYFEVEIAGTVNENSLLGQENTWLEASVDYDEDGLTTLTEITAGSDPFIVDTDCDGLDDNQEILVLSDGLVSFYSNPSLKDSDFDGLSDKTEHILELDPLNPDQDGDSLLDGWEYFASEIGWNSGNDIVDSIFADPETPCSTNWFDMDIDNDGLSNSCESFAFTNPYSSDTDGDGLRDDEEVINGLDPTSSVEGFLDFDEDGLSTSLEIEIGTFYNIADSDGDGLTDGEEYLGYRTDPLDVDTDNDNVEDGIEIYILHSNPNNPDTDGDQLTDDLERYFSTDPNNEDTDGDGLLDFAEIYTHGTDPLDVDTDGDGWKDGYEVYSSGTNPRNKDTDGDGIDDLTEFNWWKNSYGQSDTSAFSKIKDYDSDNDGLSDGYEKSHNYNPLDNDMDNDGLTDGHEVNVSHTDPNDADSDNDGYSDGYEVCHGTDPNDSTDYPGSGDIGFDP